MKRLILPALLAVSAYPGWAQDPVKVSPNLYTVLLENERVRVLEYRAKAGDKEPLHSHPEGVVYIIDGGKVRAITNGKSEELDAQPGTALWINAVTHAFEYVGPRDGRMVIVEMKGPSRATSGAQGTTESTVRSELARLTQRFSDAMKAGDVETPVSLWTEDAWAAEPGRATPITGRAGMRQWFRDTYGAGRITNLAFHPIELKVHNDYAYETGHFVFTLQPSGGAAPMNDQGHYFIEWHRGADGQWRARREVWNSAVPPSPQR